MIIWNMDNNNDNRLVFNENLSIIYLIDAEKKL